MPRSIWTKEREAQFKTDFLPQKPDIEELQMCIDGLQKHRIDLERQLAAANARIAEITNRLESAEEVCWSLFTDCCEWQVDVDALKAWREKYEKQYLAEYETKAALEEK